MNYQVATTTAFNEIQFRPPVFTEAPNLSRVFALTSEDEAEALTFLNMRPVHTVVMTSFILDNGIESSLNRGTFVGYRSEDGDLEGVALIGHTTLVEARSDEAIKALAFAARQSDTPLHLIMSSGQAAESFWNYFDEGFNQPRLSCTELLFEVSFPYLVPVHNQPIRPAVESELLPIAEAQAAIAVMESGVDPMETDREGFLKRVARRIEQGRIFVLFEGDQLVFKADIIAQSSDVIYLEGIYVAPEFRGQGLGSSCLATLTIDLLKQVQNVCLLSNINFIEAHLSYFKAGYKNTDSCTTLFA